MKLKTIAAFFLLTVLLLGFAACVKKPAVETTVASSTPVQTEQTVTEEPIPVYEITVWCGSNLVELTKQQIEAFNEAQNDAIRIQAHVEGVSRDEAAARILDDAAAGADLFCFDSDRLAGLVRAGALSELEEADAAYVNESNVPNAARAAAWSGGVYAYPMSADGSYFMYYDKTVIREPTSLDAILATCEEADKKICFDLHNGWYLASFFIGAGCVSEWTMDQNGHWIVNDSFDSDEGLVAMKGLNQIMSSSSFCAESSAAAFGDGAAVVVGGFWEAITAQQLLGDKLGVAVLPKFRVDDESYPLIPFLRCEMLGIKPQHDAEKTAVLHRLARYLTGTEAQLERCNAAGTAPSDLEALRSNEILYDPVLTVAAAQTQNAYLQNAPDDWWELVEELSVAAVEGEDDADWKDALQTYQNGVTLLENLKPGLLFVGAWNEWNNAAVEDTYMLSGDGELLSLTLEVPEDEDRGGRIVQNGKWEIDKGYAQITTGKELALDLGDENPDNNIIFAEPGTYQISINTTNNEITLERLDAPEPTETE